jgi:hypothetical protein
MKPGTIVLVIIIIVLLYFLISSLMSGAAVLTNLNAGTTMLTIASQALSAAPGGGTAYNFSYSIWFFVSDWSLYYGKKKILFGRLALPLTADGGTTIDIANSQPCPCVYFDENQNNLHVFQTTQNKTGISYNTSEVIVQNVPIQKWVNFLMSVNGSTLDIYINGKLSSTTVMKSFAYVNNSSNVYVTPLGGFSGWTSKFQYMPKATDPQTAWNIYQQGYGSSWLGIFNQYQVKLAVLQSGAETNSITI